MSKCTVMVRLRLTLSIAIFSLSIHPSPNIDFTSTPSSLRAIVPIIIRRNTTYSLLDHNNDNVAIVQPVRYISLFFCRMRHLCTKTTTKTSEQSNHNASPSHNLCECRSPLNTTASTQAAFPRWIRTASTFTPASMRRAPADLAP